MPVESRGCCCFVCVSTASLGVVEQFGQYKKFAEPGFTCMCWPAASVVGTISTRVRQLDVTCETKTKDNVFLRVSVSVQYHAMIDKAYEAFYKLTSPQQQIRSYVFDSIRSTLPKLNLDAAFATKDEIAHSVRDNTAEAMDSYGYKIVRTLITDLEPDIHVKNSMNEINATARLREAASNKADADKILEVKSAEAAAEAKYLSGVGVSRQRQAILGGLRESVSSFADKVQGTTPQDAMDLVLMTQYLDLLKDVGADDKKTSTIFLQHGPQTVAQLKNDIGKHYFNDMDRGTLK